MKPSPDLIRFDQKWLHEQRKQQARKERISYLCFAAMLAVVATGSVWLCLTLAAKVM